MWRWMRSCTLMTCTLLMATCHLHPTELAVIVTTKRSLKGQLFSATTPKAGLRGSSNSSDRRQRVLTVTTSQPDHTPTTPCQMTALSVHHSPCMVTLTSLPMVISLSTLPWCRIPTLITHSTPLLDTTPITPTLPMVSSTTIHNLLQYHPINNPPCTPIPLHFEVWTEERRTTTSRETPVLEASQGLPLATVASTTLRMLRGLAGNPLPSTEAATFPLVKVSLVLHPSSQTTFTPPSKITHRISDSPAPPAHTPLSITQLNSIFLTINIIFSTPATPSLHLATIHPNNNNKSFRTLKPPTTWHPLFTRATITTALLKSSNNKNNNKNNNNKLPSSRVLRPSSSLSIWKVLKDPSLSCPHNAGTTAETPDSPTANQATQNLLLLTLIATTTKIIIILTITIIMTYLTLVAPIMTKITFQGVMIV